MKQASNYQKEKAKAKRLYIKIGRVPSPALSGGHVAFTSKGFTHLIRKGKNPRPRREQIKRFTLISYAEAIVKNPKAVLVYRTNETKYWVNRYGKRILITS